MLYTPRTRCGNCSTGRTGGVCTCRPRTGSTELPAKTTPPTRPKPGR